MADPASAERKTGGWRANLLLALVSLLFSCLALELGTRAFMGVPVFTVQDWRLHSVTRQPRSANNYDPDLGWVLRPLIPANGMSTIEHGIRANRRSSDETPDPHSILAVGDSFTAGSEVYDNETWPAHLEMLTGRRVLNAGVGAYGIDQIIMRAEKLLPIVRPRVVLVGFLAPDDIVRAGYSQYGLPKPYYVQENGVFVRKNSPVPTTDRALRQGALWRQVVARSFAAHLIFRAVDGDSWMEAAGHVYTRAANNPGAIACHLLDRLAGKLKQAGTIGYVVVQHGGWIFSRKEPRARLTEQVIRCARAAGYGVIDEFDSLSAIAARSLDELRQHYVMHDNGRTYGHMSSKGNLHMATLIAEALKGPPPVAVAEPARVEQPGAGVNLLTGVALADLQKAAVVTSQTPDKGPVNGAPVFRLAADDAASEHYTAITWVSDRPGRHVASLYVAADPDVGFRVQLLDAKSNGAIGDYAIASTMSETTKVGAATQTDFTVTPGPPGWVRVSLTADLPESRGVLIIQIARSDLSTNFRRQGFGIRFTAPMVEAGSVPSAYCAPAECRK